MSRTDDPDRPTNHYAWKAEVERDGGYEYRTIIEFSSGARSVSYGISEAAARRRVANFKADHDPRAVIRFERRKVEPWVRCVPERSPSEASAQQSAQDAPSDRSPGGSAP